VSDNKRLAREFFGRFTANDVAGALACLTDDATWWIAGKPGVTPTSGMNDRRKLARLFDNMMAQLKDGLQMTVKGIIAEGDRVAVEVESRGELKNGRVYNNEYHFVLTFRDGKISAVREYLDTQHVHATWFAR
jgi:ketosteroid isomerase-like protein